MGKEDKKEVVAQSASTDMDTEGDQPREAENIAKADLVHNVKLVQRGVNRKDPQLCGRAVRRLAVLRKQLNSELVTYLANTYLSDGLSALFKSALTSDAMETSEEEAKPAETAPEAQMFVALLSALFMLDTKGAATAKDMMDALFKMQSSLTTREAFPISAQVCFYYTHVYELLGKSATIVSSLQTALRKCTLGQDYQTQAVLINALVRIYLNANLIEQAHNLVSNTTFPDTADANQSARHHYYLGRIAALRLEYTKAEAFLTQATRKAPEGAVGFQQQVHKLLITVQLLLGEIPDRALFFKPQLKNCLAPYFEVTKAVRSGDVAQFVEIVNQSKAKLLQDRTYTLIQRVRHSVLKSGLKLITLSYSRISLANVATKLGLESEEDAMYIAAKAIRDGVIDASLDPEGNVLISKDIVDVYSTTEPQEAFHKRIEFCLQMHDTSIKSMRYSANAYKKHLLKDTLDGVADVEAEAELEVEEEEGEDF
eukprot:m.10545 g.10545  ORF g.10545 m.10545 type:complete len:484 (-) comp5583_c0_seq1:167-1618(-)